MLHLILKEKIVYFFEDAPKLNFPVQIRNFDILNEF